VRNIVFWYDDAGAFAGEVDALGLDNARVVKVYDDKRSNFQDVVRFCLGRRRLRIYFIVTCGIWGSLDKERASTRKAARSWRS
jgi:hypothetical protein